MSAFNFLRFSCSFFVHCFAKSTKKKRGNGYSHGHSDSDDDEPAILPKTAMAAAKSAIAKLTIRIRPPRPVTKPRLVSFLSIFLKPKTIQRPELQPPRIGSMESEINYKNSAVLHRRGVQKRPEMNQSWSKPETDVASLGTMSSDEDSHLDSVLESDIESCSFDDLSPRTSTESMLYRQGLNPTFYDVDIIEEDDFTSFQNATELKRMENVVFKRENSYEEIQDVLRRPLLLNPAYGVAREDSESSDPDIQIATKLKDLKTAVQSGCRVFSSAPVTLERQYIGHTSLNPTYGDEMTESDSSEDEENDASNSEGCLESRSCPRALTSPLPLADGSIPVLSFLGMPEGPSPIQDLGTLTWRNTAFCPSESSKTETENHPAVTHLQIQWKKTLHTDSVDLPPSPFVPSSPFDESSGLDVVQLRFHKERKDNASQRVKGITKTLVTPIHTVPHETFEEIDIQCHSVLQSLKSDELKPGKIHPQKGANWLATGFKQTRWALRSVSLFLDRVGGSSDKIE